MGEGGRSGGGRRREGGVGEGREEWGKEGGVGEGGGREEWGKEVKSRERD